MKQLIRNLAVFLLLAFCCDNTGHAQSVDKDYIRMLTTVRDSSLLEQIDYYDGLGRKIQTVRKGQSPDGSDIASHFVYDHHGRAGAALLPVAIAANGQYSTLSSLQNAGKPVYNDGYLLSRVLYEASSDGRPLTEYNPGTDWLMKGKTVAYTYGLNTSSGELSCPLYTLTHGDTENSTFRKTGDYPAASLTVSKTVDEDGKVCYEFTNAHGELVLQRRILDGEAYLDTYYIYDAFGNLRVVLSPEASRALTSTGTNWTDAVPAVRNHACLYSYDLQKRCVAKRLPGTDWTYYRYDRAGHLLFTQDGELRKRNKWLFTLCDRTGREVMRGLCDNDNTGSFADMTVTATFSKEKGSPATGYLIENLTLDNPEYHAISYYDSYEYLKLPCLEDVRDSLAYVAYSSYTAREFLSADNEDISVRGLLTGTRVFSLKDGGSENVNAYYYDKYNHVVQEACVNRKSGMGNRVCHKLYASGRPVQTLHMQNKGTHRLTEHLSYAYDSSERLSSLSHRIGGGKPVILQEFHYDKVGRMVRKFLNDRKDSLSYRYNVRGWLTEISGSRFSQNLYYNTGSGILCYNGNISSMTWRAGNETVTRGYKFSYDNLNRLLKATYGEGDRIADNPERYTEAVGAYDCNGNILNLQRYGQTGADSYGLIDNLSMTLDGNRPVRVDDAATATAYNDGFGFKDAVRQADEYAYDSNGNLTKDLNKNISFIRYNCLNLPDSIRFVDGGSISYEYDGNGTKLRTVHKTGTTATTTDYCGTVIYENGSPKTLLTGEGYVTLSDVRYHYYLRDHQGNNRVVISQTGTVEETSHYYPFGGTFASAVSVQPYKYNGKELDTYKGLDWHDYGARHYDAALGRFHTVDRFAEKYTSMSPYQYGGNNPVRNIDVNGDSISLAPIQNMDRQIGTSFSQQIIDDLQIQTGLTLSLNVNGVIEYAKDANGNPVVSTREYQGKSVLQGSKSARRHIVKAIDHQDVLDVVHAASSGVPSGTNTIYLGLRQINSSLKFNIVLSSLSLQTREFFENLTN